MDQRQSHRPRHLPPIRKRTLHLLIHDHGRLLRHLRPLLERDNRRRLHRRTIHRNMTDIPGLTGYSVNEMTERDEKNLGFGPGCGHRGSFACRQCPFVTNIPHECDYICCDCPDNTTCPCADPANTEAIRNLLNLQPTNRRLINTQGVLNYIITHPGRSSRQIAQAISFTIPATRPHLKKLKDQGKIYTTRAKHNGRITLYFPGEEP